MPLTPHPGSPNVPWGNQMGSWTDYIPPIPTLPVALKTARGTAYSYATDPSNLFNAFLYVAGAYMVYRLFKGAKYTVHAGHRKIKHGIEYGKRAPKAAAAAFRAGREAEQKAWSEAMSGIGDN